MRMTGIVLAQVVDKGDGSADYPDDNGDGGMIAQCRGKALRFSR